MVGVLFDFDGTLGDTEAPAMDVAFWELAPFMPSLELLATDPAGLDAARDAFVVENAGKAFEFMLEKVDAERAASGGLLPIEQAWARDLAACALTASPLAAAVDTQRAKLGLKTLADIFSASAAEPTLLAQQKADTNARLAIAATPTPNTPAALEALVKATCAVPPSRGPTSCSSSHEKPLASASPQAGVPFVIATTSGKPRVPICVDACGFRAHFPSDDANIHSGESDFDPPRFKPALEASPRLPWALSGGSCFPAEPALSHLPAARSLLPARLCRPASAAPPLPPPLPPHPLLPARQAPDVYLRAASYVGGGGGLPPARCVAVEDSASGVGSAANAKIGLIVGYVGASHITDKDGHARVLTRGDRSEDGRGADVVLADMADLPAVVAAFGAGGVAAVRGASWVRLPSCSS